MKLLLLLTTLLPSTLAAKLTTVYQFPNGTWLENLALTRNASILVSLIGTPQVHIVHPHTTPATSSLVATFPNATAVLGITSLTPTHDLFAVAVGTAIPPNSIVPGSFSIWTVALTSTGPARVHKLVALHNMQMANGVALINPHTLLLADPLAGNIVKLDLRSKAYDVVLEHPTLDANLSSTLPLGVNGVRIHKDYLYYSNSVQSLLGRVRINMHTGSAIGAFETITSGANVREPDDFAVRRDGSVVLARPLGDALVKIGVDGQVETVASGGAVSGATSVVLGGENVVFLSTSGLREEEVLFLINKKLFLILRTLTSYSY
ncbi:hypothetical protein CC86DRAFT_403366 [Ophiobolus disseminans]|uniref:Uncharacterized protein n=1 Tax=Ophiobolus disseminans TaxID=1469910 RepID=A0A6A7AA66_9PLEO|nr:hypothetical protein CC86DRAFT_403366 [Ophiobolus disseminans]